MINKRKRIELPRSEMLKLLIDAPEGTIHLDDVCPTYISFSKSSLSLIEGNYNRDQYWVYHHPVPKVVWQDIVWYENIPENGLLVYKVKYPMIVYLAIGYNECHSELQLLHKTSFNKVSDYAPVDKDHHLIKQIMAE